MSVQPSADDTERFRSLVSHRLGLAFDDAKLGSLAELLAERVAATGISVGSYLRAFEIDRHDRSELRRLAAQLTVGETYFLRNADQFRALAEVAVPNMLERRASERRLAILSAGCATGEEPYSVAIVLHGLLAELRGWDVWILGIDISADALAKAQRGTYSAWSLRQTPDAVRSRWFTNRGRDFVLDPSIRSMVSFEEKNLVEDDPVFWRPAAFDVILCRNVVMYFGADHARRVIHRFARALTPGGYLFLGHAETLRGTSDEFDLCHTHDTFYYRVRDGSDSRLGSSRGTEDLPGRATPLDATTGTSWFDVVARATARIEALGATGGMRRQDDAASIGESTPRPPAWNLDSTLALLRAERFADALSALQELPAQAGDDPDVELLRAVLLVNAAEIAEAERACAHLLERDGANASATYVLGLCREHVGDLPGAAERYHAAAYFDPSFAMPHLHLALLARRSGDIEAAREVLGRTRLLLERENAARILLFGGGFGREGLLALCDAELRACGGEP